MKLSFSKDELLNGLQIIQSAISAKTTLPILSNFLIEAKQGVVKLSSTNLEISVQTVIKGEIIQEGEITIPAKKFSDIIRELPMGSDIAVESNESLKIDIKCQKTFFSIKGLAKEEFPVIPEFSGAKTVTVSKKLLEEMCRKTIFSVSTDETRYVLNGLYMLLRDGKIAIVTTDGRRLSLAESDSSEKKINKGIIIPSKTIQELIKLFVVASSSDEVQIQIMDNQAAFQFDSTCVFTRLVEGNFPNYEQVIPKSSNHSVNIKKEEFLAVTKRAALCVIDRGGSVKYTVSKGKLVVSASSHNAIEFKDEMEIAYEGTTIEIAFNPIYLLDVLKNIDSQEIVFEFTSSVNPGVLKPLNGGKFIYIIMPMKIS